jgi:PAS domain S-box-containing protein
MECLDPVPFQILDHVPNGCCILGEGGLILFWNRTLEAWTGQPASAMVGGCLYEAFPELRQPRFRDRIREVFRIGMPTVFSAALNPQFFPSSRPGGGPRIQQTTVNRLEPGPGGTGRVLVTVSDVTDQFERGQKYRAARSAAVEEARVRREAEAKHRVVVELCSDGILLGTLDGRILDCNSAVSELFGYPKEELLGLSVLDLFPDPFQAIFQEIVTGVVTPGGRQMEIFGRRKNGTLFSGELNAKLFSERNNKQFLMYVHDASERKRTEEVLRLAQKQESLGALAGGIAHDFNNLFGAMLGNLELGMARLPGDSPAHGYFRKIQDEILHAADLSTKMLALSGRGRFSVMEIQLVDLVRSWLPFLQARVSHRTSLSFQSTPGVPIIEADPDQVQQVLVALVNNAAEAMGTGGGAIEIRTGMEDLDEAMIRSVLAGQTLRPGPHLTLAVRDGGCGIGPENLGRIFDPFFTTKAAGRGLSLAVALGILRSHRGGIHVTSQGGAGTTFKLFFPVIKARSPIPERLFAQPCPPPPVERILLVEDEPDLRASTSELLQFLGFQVVTARDGVEALDCFTRQGQDIDLVLMDLTMPRMDGRDAFYALKEVNPNIRVILSSGHSEHDVAQEFQGQGLAGFLQKPYRIAELEAALARVARPRQ